MPPEHDPQGQDGRVKRPRKWLVLVDNPRQPAINGVLTLRWYDSAWSLPFLLGAISIVSLTLPQLSVCASSRVCSWATSHEDPTRTIYYARISSQTFADKNY